jgi:hypothetical protein
LGEGLGFDFETTGVDRCTGVPVSSALVTLVGGKLDYDSTPLSSTDDRHREGSRTLGALCAHYGVAIERAHTPWRMQ